MSQPDTSAVDRGRRISTKAMRLGWIPTVAALAAVVVFVSAGNWQHRRMLESEGLRARVAAADRVATVDVPSRVSDWTSWRFRHVTVTGTFDAVHQILVDNVIHDGRAGFDVVTPLTLGDGRRVLVARGWFPLEGSRARLPMPAPPAGEVTFRGRIDIPTTHYLELGGRRAPTGPVWENLDPGRYAAATGIAVLPIVIEAVDDRAGEGLLREWTPADYGIVMHQGYMLQWYTFAAMVAGLWIWFALRPWWRRRRSSAAARGAHREVHR